MCTINYFFKLTCSILMFVNKIGQYLTTTEMHDIKNPLAYHGQDFKEA